MTAAARCAVGFLSREYAVDLVRRYPEVLVNAHRELEEAQRRLAARLADLAYVGTRQRLVRVLLALAEEHGATEGGGVRIDLPLSLGDLVEMIGASRQGTCKELQVLRREGLIEVAWPRVSILDVGRLRRLG